MFLVNIDAACFNYLGNGRLKNEDNFYFNDKYLSKDNSQLNEIISFSSTNEKANAFAIFDGMGGESCGEEASFLAAKLFSSFINEINNVYNISQKDLLKSFCNDANNKVNEISRLKGVTVGTTFAGIVINGEQIYACNIGDSKIYKLTDSKISQISVDHTDKRIIDAMGLNKKPVLLQYLGIGKEEISIDPYIVKGTVKTGTTFVICSDGVTDVVSPEEIYKLSKECIDSSALVERIINSVKEYNGKDNATVIAVVIK